MHERIEGCRDGGYFSTSFIKRKRIPQQLGSYRNLIPCPIPKAWFSFVADSRRAPLSVFTDE